MAAQIKQNWTLKKILCYLVYRLLAKHLPSNFPLIGNFAQRLRRLACRPLFMKSAKIVSIGKSVDFDNGCNLILKDYANIGDYALLAGSHATITIGRHVMMGKHCIIICQNHKYLEEGFAGFEGKNVLIDDFAWIGHRVTVLPGVRIGKHAIIGAGAVVSKDIPDYAIAVGNPAVVKKYRKHNP
jgi:maltose O-acetyltransferase